MMGGGRGCDDDGRVRRIAMRGRTERKEKDVKREKEIVHR